jgi:hypothetical protein
VPFWAPLFGALMIKVLSPDHQQRFKAPPRTRPSASSIEPTIVERFLAQQRETLARMQSLESHQPATIIMTSPFSSVITYSLLDAFRLLVAHERRHFGQARRVMETSGFPR